VADPVELRNVRVKLGDASGLTSHYATNFLIQGTNHEVMITFFEARPPMIVGSVEEQKAQWDKVREVDAVPLARIIIAASRMTEFLQVLQDGTAKSGAASVKSAAEVQR
jgi:hypothetical protein